MKKSRFTESQIVAILKEGEAGLAVAQLARKYGISAATYYHWKSKYAGAGVPELKRLRELETEIAVGIARLRRLVAGFDSPVMRALSRRHTAHRHRARCRPSLPVPRFRSDAPA
jgi:putative transposase